jgi:hypothetical protein
MIDSPKLGTDVIDYFKKTAAEAGIFTDKIIATSNM